MKTVFKSAKKFFAAAACLSVLFTVFVGCNNPAGGGQKLSQEKKLTGFKFEKANNPGLANDVAGSVDEISKTVSVIVPNGTDITKLKASFVVSSKARASVKKVAQESGKTENNFSSLVHYMIIAEDGSTETYRVHVEVAPAAGQFSGNKILSFEFRKDVNPGLAADVSGIVGTNKAQTEGFCFIKFPVGTTEATIKSLKPTFIASAKAELFIDEVKLKSSKTAVDFYDLEDGTDITVYAEDGNSIIYKVVVEIDLPNASRRAVRRLFGSYYTFIPALNSKAVIVLEENKVTLYSTAMSMDYENIEWEVKADGSYTCTTYKKKKPQIKNLYGRGGYEFTEEAGKITVKTNIMGVSVTATKGDDFTWTKESGYKPVRLHI